MHSNFDARDVNEAVELATKFKEQGQYDWFRGQTVEWPLEASFVRRSEAEQEQILRHLGRYLNWVKNTPGLEALVQDEDKAIAVAQHYGLPTTFIDFTTEPRVAGFFASNGHRLPKKKRSCILCPQYQRPDG